MKEIHDMLAATIKFNRTMMARAELTMAEYVQGDAEWEYAYQIYRDASDAFDAAHRAIKYGIGDLDAPSNY